MCCVSNNKNFLLFEWIVCCVRTTKYFYYGMNVRIQSRKLWNECWIEFEQQKYFCYRVNVCVVFEQHKKILLWNECWIELKQQKYFCYRVNVCVVFEQQNIFVIEWMCVLCSNNIKKFYYGMNVRIQSRKLWNECVCCIRTTKYFYYGMNVRIQSRKFYYYRVNVCVVFEQQNIFIMEWMLGFNHKNFIIIDECVCCIRTTKIFLLWNECWIRKFYYYRVNVCVVFEQQKYFYYGMNVEFENFIIIEWMCVLYSNNKNIFIMEWMCVLCSITKIFIMEWMLGFNHENFIIIDECVCCIRITKIFYYRVNVCVVFEQTKIFYYRVNVCVVFE